MEPYSNSGGHKYPNRPQSQIYNNTGKFGRGVNRNQNYGQQSRSSFAEDDISWVNRNPYPPNTGHFITQQGQPRPIRRRTTTTYYNGHSAEDSSSTSGRTQQHGFVGPPRYGHNNSHHFQHPSLPYQQSFSRGRGTGVRRVSHGYPQRNQMNHGPRPPKPHQQRPEDMEVSEGPGKPWLTPEHLAMIEERNKLYDIYANEKSEESYRLFKVKRIEVNMAINDAKYLYHQQYPEAANIAPVVPTVKFIRPAFYCDPCDKKFANKEALDEHNTEHITCKLDGCTYTAHVKLVMKHIELQHSTNLYLRIKGYDTPEEIEKWKTERKKNFPTPENIARKKAERAERLDRGEMFEEKDELEDETYRHKIIPEHRVKRVRESGPGYQSDGDEEYVTKRFKNGKCQSRLPHKENPFSTLNKSPIIILQNIYTDIELQRGQVIGTTRKPWVIQFGNVCDDNEIKNFSKDPEQQEESFDAFNITDDEADDCLLTRDAPSEINVENSVTSQKLDTVNVESIPLKVSKGIASTPPSISVSPDVSIPSNECNKTDGHGTALGLHLVSYSSDSDSSSEDNLQDERDEVVHDKEDIEDGELGSDQEMADEEAELTNCLQNDDNLNQSKLEEDPSSSDGEAPDELPAKAVISNVEETEVEPFVSQIADEKLPLSKPQKSHKINKKPLLKVSEADIQLQQHRIAAGRSIVKKYTLLQRLLAPDIRRERNVVLQACRYIVENNFFDPPPPERILEKPKPDLINQNRSVEEEDGAREVSTETTD